MKNLTKFNCILPRCGTHLQRYAVYLWISYHVGLVFPVLPFIVELHILVISLKKIITQHRNGPETYFFCQQSLYVFLSTTGPDSTSWRAEQGLRSVCLTTLD